MPTLKATFDGLLLAKGQEIADTIPDDTDPRRLATVAYAMGIQTALELAMLSPEVARELIADIHMRQALDDDGSAEEQNGTALDFLRIYHRG